MNRLGPGPAEYETQFIARDRFGNIEKNKFTIPRVSNFFLSSILTSSFLTIERSQNRHEEGSYPGSNCIFITREPEQIQNKKRFESNNWLVQVEIRCDQNEPCELKPLEEGHHILNNINNT